MPLRRFQLWTGLVLWALSAALYLPTLRHEFVPFDDPQYVSANPQLADGLSWHGLVRTFTEPYFANWSPLTTLSYAAEFRVYRLWPGGYLVTNLLLHATATLLLFLALDRLTGAPRRSALVAALFAFHPLHVESVAWISQRKDVLSAVFFMGVLWSYAHYAEQPSFRRYAWVGGLFILGLLSKPMLVTVPFVLLLLDVWPLGRVPLDEVERAARSLGKLSVEKIPLFLLSMGSSYATYLAQKGYGSMAPLEALSLPLRLMNVPVAYSWYLSKNLWPSHLAFFYPLDPDHLTFLRVLGATALLAMLSVGALLALRRATYLAVGWLWFLGMLVPVIGIMQVGRQSWADRYAYLPLVGIEVALVWGAGDLARRIRLPQAALLAGAGAACAALMLSTHRQIATWENGLTLAQQAIDAGFETVTAHTVEANTYAEGGKLVEARRHLGIALRTDPNFRSARILLAQLDEKEGDYEGAAAEYRKVLEKNPNYEMVILSLSDALIQLGRHDEALSFLIEPKNKSFASGQAERELEIGLALGGKGDVAAAIPHYRRAIELRPGLARAHLNLGRALTRTGQLREGEDQLRQVLAAVHNNADAWGFLADNLQLQGRLGDAVASWREALSARGDWLEAKNNLAWLLATAGDPAVRRPEEAIALAKAMAESGGGRNASILDTLAAAYAAAGQREDAVRTAREALALARQGGSPELAGSIQDHLHHYEAGGGPPVTPAADSRAG